MEQHALASGKAFTWHELYTPDRAASLEFYQKALGMEVMESENPETGPYTMLKINGAPVAGLMETSTPEMQNVPPHWAVYLAVDDVDARAAKCVELGGSVAVPAMDIPTVGRMCLIADPQGAHIWLFKSAHE